jgi:hypothetical protein
MWVLCVCYVGVFFFFFFHWFLVRLGPELFVIQIA